MSDFYQYWVASLDFAQYIKGGILIIVYAIFSRFGIPAFLAATIINFSSFLLLAFVFPKNRYANWILLFIGFSWAVWSPIVNSDLPHTALLVAGISLLLKRKYLIAFMLIAFASSIRLQIVPVSILVLCILLVTSFRYRIVRKELLIVIVAIIIGLLIDAGLKMSSVQRVEIVKSQRVPIYAGLIATKPGEKCGEITSFAKEKVQLEKDKPLLSVLKLPPELPSILLCKWVKIATYSSSASFWLQKFNGGSIYQFIYVFESIVVFILKGLCVWLLIKNQNSPYAKIAFIFLVGYFGVHTFLEIQSRYLMPPLALSLFFLCYELRPSRIIPCVVYKEDNNS